MLIFRFSRCASASLASALLIVASATPGFSEEAVEAPKIEEAPLSASDPEARARFRLYLFEALQSAETLRRAKEIEGQIWAFWLGGPNEEAKAKLRDAQDLMRSRRKEDALRVLGELIAAYPNWAEPYNQRAILRFVHEEYDAALADIDRVLKREPKHFGALSGGAQIHLNTGRAEAGFRMLQQATKINPWIGGQNPAKRGQEPI